MRKLKNYKMILTIIVIIAAIVNVVILGAFSIWTSGMKTSKDIAETAEKKGYAIKFEDDFHFCITEDKVEYYYEIKLGKVILQEIYTEKPSKTEHKVVDNKGEITIEVIGEDKYRVIMEDGVIGSAYKGDDTIIYEHIYFVCSSEFTKESIDPKNIVTRMAKAEKNYNKITKNFISAEELQDLLGRANEILEELNER